MAANQNWKTKFQESFKSSSEFYQYLGWEDPFATTVEKKYPLFVPRPLADKIKAQGPLGVLARQFLPSPLELQNTSSGLVDPIGDKEFNRAPQLIHRYSSRALFTPTTICPVHCRYCFRKNELNANEELFAPDFERTISYLRDHPEISEIIFTGGDPLTLSDEKLSRFLERFSEIPSIKDIRFHTRYPVILPERLDESFKQMIRSFSRKFRTMSLAIHVNHSSELDEENTKIIRELSSLDLQLLSQTVLLKNVNNNVASLIELFNRLIELKVRPYYLHHPDRVKGGMHFYLSLEEGRALYSQLRSELPGWAIPHYVIDIPGGAGKVSAFNPESLSFGGTLLGLRGETHSLEEPDLIGS